MGGAARTMRNRRPIFLVGFARGGTNLVLNLLRSHPEVCSPRGETHEVFRGKPSEPRGVRRAKRLRALPVRLLEGRDVFDAADWTPRTPLRALSGRWIDRVLYAEKLRAREDGQNRWKTQGVAYTREEIARARLLCKNVNGLILLSRALAGVWPDARFVALVRDGRAVCEGQVRRGADLAEAARRYELGCRAIAEDAEQLPDYHVFRYEDLVASPQETLKSLYEAVDLDLGAIPKLRLETKAVIDVDGAHRIALGANEKRLLWYDRDDFGRHLRGDANANQLARLSEAEQQQIAEHCAWSLHHFGYR
jgi:hypothetical protein